MEEQIHLNTWRKAEIMHREQIIRFQILVHCHLSGIRLSPAELDCLAYIALHDRTELKPLCETLAQKRVFKSHQSARNSLDLLEDKKLLMKEGTWRKKVYLNPEMKIQTEGNIRLDIQCLSRE